MTANETRPSLKYLLLPPVVNALLILAGLAMGARRLAGGLLVTLGLASLLALSTPLASHALRQGLEPPALAGPGQLRQAEAIVILGGTAAAPLHPANGHLEDLAKRRCHQARLGAVLVVHAPPADQ